MADYFADGIINARILIYGSDITTLRVDFICRFDFGKSLLS